MIPIKDNYKIRYGPDYGRPHKGEQIIGIIRKKNPSLIALRGLQFQFLPKPARGLLGQKRGGIDNNYGRQ